MALSSKQKLHRFMATAHKWIGLFVGIQILLWTAGGLVMSWLPLEEVRGEHKISPTELVALPPDSNLLTFVELAELTGGPVTRMNYEMLLGKPVAKLFYVDGTMEIRDAVTGTKLTPISKELAQEIAEADFAPDHPVSDVIELGEHNIDYRGPLPVWRISFDDAETSTLYVSPTQARVVARRSDTWRFYDFFWMLHIMDYEERHDTNNPLLVVFSLSAFLFAISGIFLLFFRFYRRDFNFILGQKTR